MLESRGFATVTIGLVRHHMEQTRPPRGLWVPFQLGRPLGEPEDPAFQRRVLMQALGLLERTDGPVLLEDFPDDPPNWTDTPDWRPPAAASTDISTGWEAAFAAELAALRPAWDRARQRYGRTTGGLAGVGPADWPSLAARFLAGDLPTVPAHDTPALALRFLCDDIKSFYGEAAQADGPAPSARQIDTWFWQKTVAGALLNALRAMAIMSENNAIKTVGGRFFVPVPWLTV